MVKMIKLASISTKEYPKGELRVIKNNQTGTILVLMVIDEKTKAIS